jgi:hypothetical protein
MNAYNLHPTLTRSFVEPNWPDEDVLIWMTLLHLHKITLKPGVAIDGISQSTALMAWEPETRRGAAECVASVWPGSDKRSNPAYWSSLYDIKTPYEDVSEIPVAIAGKMNGFRNLLKSHPMVEDVLLES